VTQIDAFLELASLDQLVPPEPISDVSVEMRRVSPPDGAVNSWFYRQVGSEFGWADLAGLSAFEWQRRAESLDTWVATSQGRRAGWYELDPREDGSVELTLLGVLAFFRRRGLGGQLVTHAARTAFEELGATKLCLRTATVDDEAALPNYLARGFRITRTASYPAI